MSDLDDGARAWIDLVVAGSPVAKALGVEVVAAEVDRVRVRVPYDDGLTTVPETVHGGVIATLIDIAGAASSASGLTAGDGATGGATSHLSVTYLAPARGDLEAVATVVHRSRSMSQSDVAVRAVGGDLVAVGQVTSRVFH
ncbi:PaaI family thioesterase [Nocardioides marmoriginsengisoli]|uniref:PaaI family thioesterase n=1 Tax=Nocardioides marmoriginsengisoli TaxID=661483 RepID=A0A3N0CR27_9ACTN|nr:PaaI family thioesterase [Nocardioides marmoriginsengisoli]RNL65363.1 PaaI family thioesterase [Nocardioides marmoriginsengisoli]